MSRNIVKKKPINGYSFLEILGSGTYGRVYLATKNSKNYAIKMVNYGTEKEQILADSEEKVFKQLKDCCPYLVNFVESFEDDDFKYFVMEYCECGTLKETIDAMIKFKLTIPEERVWKIIAQFFIALAFMNKNNLAHRDVKDNNIFIDENYNIKLGDYGLTKEVSFDSQKLETFQVGTFVYMAPEVICDKEENKRYDVSCDVWSFGVVLFRLTELVIPFDGANNLEIQTKVLNSPIPPLKSKFSESLKTTILQMLQRDVSKRITLQQVFSIPQIKQTINENNLVSPPKEYITAVSRVMKVDDTECSSSFSSSSSSFSDTTSPLSHILLPNPHGRFILEGRDVKFSCMTGDDWVNRALVFKEGISDGVLEIKIKYSGDTIFFGVISFSLVEKCLNNLIGNTCSGASFRFSSDGSWFYCTKKQSGHFLKGGKRYGVLPKSAVVTGLLDMREGKHTLHFLVEKDLLPHAIVNIPKEKMHMGVSSTLDNTVTVVCVSLYSSPPPLPSGMCIAYNYNGSNVSLKDFTKLKFEDGSAIPNVKEYLE